MNSLDLGIPNSEATVTYPSNDRARATAAAERGVRDDDPAAVADPREHADDGDCGVAAVDHAAVDAALDDLALELFAVERNAQARARELATLVVGTFRSDAGTVEDLCIDDVLTARHGHPLLLATMAAELGRRSGWSTFVCSSASRWYAALRDGDRLWLVDPAGAVSGDERRSPSGATAATNWPSRCSAGSPSGLPRRPRRGAHSSCAND